MIPALVEPKFPMAQLEEDSQMFFDDKYSSARADNNNFFLEDSSFHFIHSPFDKTSFDSSLSNQTIPSSNKLTTWKWSITSNPCPLTHMSLRRGSWRKMIDEYTRFTSDPTCNFHLNADFNLISPISLHGENDELTREFTDKKIKDAGIRPRSR